MPEKIKPHHIFPVRLDEKMHEELRTLSFFTKQPIAELIREGIRMKLDSVKPSKSSKK